MNRLFRTLLPALCALTLVACDAPSSNATFRNTDITGANFGRDFALTDHTGAKRTLADYRGKVVAMFFGFTQCPDVCPTTMHEMAQVMKALGPDASRVQVVFVTVDPERDTQAVLSQYVPAFDPRFVGLTGTPDEIAAVAKEFKVFYQKVAGPTPASYTMDHFAGTYVFDAQGRIRLFVKYGQKTDDIVADVKTLLAS